MFKEEEVADGADEYKHYKLLSHTATFKWSSTVSILQEVSEKDSEYYLMLCGCGFCWVSSRLVVSWLIVGTRSRITGKFLTSCRQTSQIRVPFVLNHLMAQCSWTSLRSPLQLHSIFNVLPSSQTSRQILHTASSSGISSSVSSAVTGVISSPNEEGTHESIYSSYQHSTLIIPMNPAKEKQMKISTYHNHLLHWKHVVCLYCQKRQLVQWLCSSQAWTRISKLMHHPSATKTNSNILTLT